MKSVIKKRLLTIEPYRPGKPIDEVKRELGLKNVIKLASNENPYGPSPEVLKAIAREAKNINRYPDGGCFYLRWKLAKRLGVSSDQLIFGNGSDEIIVMTLKAFVQKGDEVILAKPSFLIYEIASQIAGAVLRPVPLTNFYYDLNGMKKAVNKKTKLIFLGNPDNPAGTYITQDQLENFLEGLSEEILVLLDEAYFEFVQKRDYPNSISFLKKMENIIITRTFSKIYGLAGLRIGYGIAHREIIDLLNRVREPFNVNSLAQVAALACLKDQSYYTKIAQRIEEQRQFLYREIQRMGLPFIETVTNFILIDVRASSQKISQQLLKKGVIIRNMDFWGLNNYIRVTIGTPRENQKFIRALREVLGIS